MWTSVHFSAWFGTLCSWIKTGSSTNSFRASRTAIRQNQILEVSHANHHHTGRHVTPRFDPERCSRRHGQSCASKEGVPDRSRGRQDSRSWSDRSAHPAFCYFRLGPDQKTSV